MLIYQRPRVVQPHAGVGINWGHPLTRGLVSAIVPYGNTAIDLVTGAAATPAGSNQISRPAPPVKSGLRSPAFGVENPSAAVGALEFAVGGSGMDSIGDVFPTIETTAETNGTAATATPVVNLPAGSGVGDLLVAIIRVAVAGGIGWPAGWTELADASADPADDNMAIAWRKVAGGEGSTVTLSSGNGRFAARVLRISNAEDPVTQPPEISTAATGTSTLPDPSSLSPTGGAKMYLWLWLGGWEGEQTSPPASNPTNYALSAGGANSGTAGLDATNCRVATAGRQLNTATEDAPSWTISASDDWTAYTVAVHPAPNKKNFSIFLEAFPHDAANEIVLSSTEGGLGDGFWVFLDDLVDALNGTTIVVNNGAQSGFSTSDAFGTGFEAWSHRFLWTFDGTNFKCYTEGKLNVTDVTAAAPLFNVNRRTRIFGRWDATSEHTGFVLALGWARELSLYEYQQLWLNPWQLFQPMMPMYFTAEAAAAARRPIMIRPLVQHLPGPRAYYAI